MGKELNLEDNLTIVIPVFNEELAVTDVIENIKSVVLDLSVEYEIIVVNDGSTDDTKKKLQNIEGIILINNSINKGYGASLKRGIKKSTYNKILIIDADGTYPVDKIPEIYSYSDEYDLVIGSRTKPGVKIPLIRKPAKFFIKLMAQFLTNSKIPDINSGLRLFRKDFVMKHWNLYPDKFSFTSTLTINSTLNNSNIKYLPIDYSSRIGKSSIRPIRDFFGFLTLIFSLVVYFKPLRFFLIPGILFLLSGTAIGINQVTNENNLGDSSLLLILVGIQICFLGVIADMLAKSR